VPGWLISRIDTELVEDLAQVVIDRVSADKQPGTDLGVREAFASHLGDLGFPRRQVSEPAPDHTVPTRSTDEWRGSSPS
jgi:hypothetical protein